MWKERSSLGGIASFPWGKENSCLGRAVTFPWGKVSSSLERVASFPGGRWAIAWLLARVEWVAWGEPMPSKGRCTVAGGELLPSPGGRQAMARVVGVEWMAREELLPSKWRWAAAGRTLLPSPGGRWAMARVGLRGAWLLAKLLLAWTRLLPSLEGRRAPAWVLAWGVLLLPSPEGGSASLPD